MLANRPNSLKYAIHGHPVEISLSDAIAPQLPPLGDSLRTMLGEWAVSSHPGLRAPVSGTIRPFVREEVSRYLSPTATRVSSPNDLIEIYQENERFWLINDHWGMCEINVLRATWRSWIIPETILDPACIVDGAVLWPIAQLLRPRGISLVPSAAITRDGWAALLLSQISLEPELTQLVRAGYRVIGQNWTALQEHSGGVELLHMPGQVDRSPARMPGMRIAPIQRVDLRGEFIGCGASRAHCNAVMLIASSRRPISGLRHVVATNAPGALRRAWPIAELHPHRRQGRLLTKLSQQTPLFELQLTRNPRDIFDLLDRARTHAMNGPTISVSTRAMREQKAA